MRPLSTGSRLCEPRPLPWMMRRQRSPLRALAARKRAVSSGRLVAGVAVQVQFVLHHPVHAAELPQHVPRQARPQVGVVLLDLDVVRAAGEARELLEHGALVLEPLARERGAAARGGARHDRIGTGGRDVPHLATEKPGIVVRRRRARAGGLQVREALQVPVGVERGHAAGGGAGDGLAVDVVLHVARGEHAGDAGGGGVALEPGARDDVAALHVELALEEVGIGLVADGDEAAGELQLARGCRRRST